MSVVTLEAHLDSSPRGEGLAGVPETVRALAAAAVEVFDLVGQGAFGAAPHAERHGAQHELEAAADSLFLGAARRAPVALYASTGLGQPVVLDPAGSVALALDPLAGSGDVEAGGVPGSLFSALPLPGDPSEEPEAPFRQPGRQQRGAGLFLYGARLSLVLTLGAGTHVFVFSRRLGAFARTRDSLVIAPRAVELAVDPSGTRHWGDAVRLYVDDCLKGAEGPRERDFALRWSGSLAADALRVLTRGGAFLSPPDARRGHLHGLLPLVCAANPLALLAEQAGGAATDTVEPLLDRVPESLKQRTPLVFGAKREVERIARYHTEPSHLADRAPLFGHRGLFRP